MQNDILKSVGNKLKEIRNSKGLSQSMLANDANVPKNQIGRIERGEISAGITTLYKICQALGIKVRELIDF
ncbi:helix-turn-helix domain-containing protein [Flavobacterium hauense]